MSSPFPGMDPYIEAHESWPSFHNALIAGCAGALNERLPEDYVARIEERICLVYPEEEPRGFRPDVSIGREETARARSGVETGIVTIEPVTIPMETRRLEEEKQTWIEVLRLPDLELVTVIEVLSPGNKSGPGRDDYLSKRAILADQPVHLVEIDLLLGGHRLPMKRPLPAGHYFAHVARAERRPDCDVYAWSIRQVIPVLPVPLRAPDADVGLDLSALVCSTYEKGRYSRTVRYDLPLPAGWALSAEDRAWATEVAQRRVR